MIEIKVREKAIEMQGHAGQSKDGIDIVCASISALTCNLVNSINMLTDDKISYEIESGMTVIRWQKLSDKAKLLIDSWFIGITAISEQYGCITFI